jgi:DNA recombination-dependent growth factor C
VEALHAIREEGGGVLFDSAASRHADTAIAAIQARMGDVEAGRLAVADVQINEGALSEAVQAGQLSTTKKRQ